MRVIISILLLFVLSFPLNAQEEFDWNDLVAWNGVNSWWEYLILSPGYFGPNALPVPESNIGLVPKNSKLDVRAAHHFNIGDHTTNLYIDYQHSFADGLVAVHLGIVPIEYYDLSTEIRDQRKLRSALPHGTAVGDLFASTHIQLIKNNEFWPDLVFEMGFRTASGSDSEDGRYTDSPGYYFDLNFGREFYSNSSMDLRWYGYLGFYAWQTNMNHYFQNDALMYSIGAQVHSNKLTFNLSLDGYYGYLSNMNRNVVMESSKPYEYDGDQPLIIRAKVNYDTGSYQYQILYQNGLNDFPYQSIMIGVIVPFSKETD